MKKRSYWAKSNRGKAGEVFLHNLLAGQGERRAEQKKAAAGRERARKAAAREREQKRKQAERVRIAKQKAHEAGRQRGRKMAARTLLLCRKYGIDELAAPLILEDVIELEAKLTELEPLVIKPRLEHWIQQGRMLRKVAETQRARQRLIERCERICQENRLPSHCVEEMLKAVPAGLSDEALASWQPPREFVEALKSAFAKELETLDYELASIAWSMQVPIRRYPPWSNWWLLPLLFAAVPVFGLVMTIVFLPFSRTRYLGWACLVVSLLSTFAVLLLIPSG